MDTDLLTKRTEEISKHFPLLETMSDQERKSAMAKYRTYLNAIHPHAEALRLYIKDKLSIHNVEWEDNLKMVTKLTFKDLPYIELNLMSENIKFGLTSNFEIIEIEQGGTITKIDTMKAVQYHTEQQWILSINAAISYVSTKIDSLLSEFLARYEAQSQELNAKNAAIEAQSAV